MRAKKAFFWQGKTLAGMRRNVVKMSEAKKAPFFGWRGEQGFYFVAEALPTDWPNPYWTTKERVVNKRTFWEVVAVYGEGAEDPDAPEPALPEPVPFQRRIFGGPEARASQRRAEGT